MLEKEIDKLSLKERTWKDIEEIFFSNLSLDEKYSLFYDVLKTTCELLLEKNDIIFPDLYTRLQTVCRITKYPLYEIDRFRWRAHAISKGNEIANETTFLADAKAFVDAIAHFTGTSVPASLVGALPREIEPANHEEGNIQKLKKIRFITERLDDEFIYASTGDFLNDGVFKINYQVNEQTKAAANGLKKGTVFNAVSIKKTQDNIILPELIVLEPDWLIDISSLSATIKNYGDSAFNYLISRFTNTRQTRATMLGNIANLFLDDCINDKKANYLDSIKKAFKIYPIALTALDKEIDQSFFEEAKRQFSNIKNVVDRYFSGAAKEHVILEPSFLCETLGIQGRFDLMTDDWKTIVELKSGKKDEFHSKAKTEHLIQMLLYKEVVYYNLGLRQNDVNGFLLYSKYPEMIEQRSVARLTQEVMRVRNNIIIMERSIREGHLKEHLSGLTVDKLNTYNDSGNLWTKWQKPQLEQVIFPFSQMDDLTSEYFYTFMKFINTEQLYSRIGDGKIKSTKGMASLWNADKRDKEENGDIICNLHICDYRFNDGIEALCMKKNNVFSASNFRIGDRVFLYEGEKDTDTVLNHQVTVCEIESSDPQLIWLRLLHKQKNKTFFKTSKTYSIEHSHYDASFNAQYQALYSLLTMVPDRRELFLAQRKPEADKDIRLNGNYNNEQINEIVLKAKQAKNYFLIVGPPGTGKTSIALKALVEEFISENMNILLMAYTNRAVDEICSMLETICSHPEYIRVGRSLSCDEAFQNHTLEKMIENVDNRKEVQLILNETSIFVGTTSAFSKGDDFFDIKSFDVAIIDESSQILEPQMLNLIGKKHKNEQAIKKFIMIGDHKQLPAVVMQPERLSAVSSKKLRDIGLTDCRNSLFERLMKINHDNKDIVAMLDHQGRMHPAIANFASKRFYDGMLKEVPLSHQLEKKLINKKSFNDNQHNVVEFSRELVIDLDLLVNSRFCFFNVPNVNAAKRQSKANLLEAECISCIVKAISEIHESINDSFDISKQVGIIVPFRRQISLVKKLLKEKEIHNNENILVDTVERYQGSQRDVIIYGTTISNYYEIEALSNETEIDGMMIDRKLNVAVTRARKQFILVGNKELLSINDNYSKLIEYADCYDTYQHQ